MATRTQKDTDAQLDDANVLSAGWLRSRYEEDVWVVSDSHDHTRRELIDFHLMLPDGRDLVDAPEYYGTVKAYAFWVRSDRFSNIDDAHTHGHRTPGYVFGVSSLS